MPKATITTADGTKVVIEGSAEEVREIVSRLHGPPKQELRRGAGRPKVPPKTRTKAGRRTPSIADGILELKEEGFFDKPKGLAQIKDQLASLGMIYPVTSLSGTVLSLVKKRVLGRVREEGRWCYVGR